MRLSYACLNMAPSADLSGLLPNARDRVQRTHAPRAVGMVTLPISFMLPGATQAWTS